MKTVTIRRGTEAVITAPTRNRLGAYVPRGFKSHPLRQIIRKNGLKYMKIKYILLSSLLCHLLFMLPSFAFSLHPEYDLFLGAPLYWYQYREPTFMKDRGVFYGIESSIAHYDPIMLKAALTLTYGHVDYTSKKTGRVHNNNDIRIETRTLAGLPIFSMKNALYIPYFGFGYRFFRGRQ